VGNLTDMPKRTTTSVPVIDISPLVNNSDDLQHTARQIDLACRDYGFFYIVGHGISPELQQQLEYLSHQFFSLDLADKLKIRMALGGKAWRGFFPVGGELTSGKPDLKEGLYFGKELKKEHPKVQAGVPLHGSNLFPEIPEGYNKVILDYMEALTVLGHTLMEGLSLSLGLEKTYFKEKYTTDPLTLFRIFHYPPNEDKNIDPLWGVGEHTDYGVLTILKQDNIGGLQVKSQGEWLDAPPIEDTFICNIGDMLDRMTGGYYKSTPHRVLNLSGKDRYSYPFFFDPNFDVKIKAVALEHIDRSREMYSDRWDGASLHEFDGTYGEYLLNKVSKVFPELKEGLG